MRHRVSNTFNILVLGSLLSLAHATSATAQDDAASAEEDTSWQTKSERQLRRELRDAEEAFFDSFNAVNSDDELDVICKTSTALGSRKRERKCQARFLWDHEEEIAQNYARRTGGSPGPTAATTAALEPKLDALRRDMSAAMAEHAEVAEAFAALTRAKQNYERKLQAK